jgi:glycosyltransferase involved in cell wall biosynthesis
MRFLPYDSPVKQGSEGKSARSQRPRVCIVRQTDHYELPIRREAEALVRAGFDVEVICMRGRNAPPEEVVDGVRITHLRSSLGKANKAQYLLDYVRFFLLVSAMLTRRHLRRRYAVIQVNTMPDFLVFSATLPKLLGSRVLAYMHEPSPELAETLFGPGLVSRVLARVEQWVLRFADQAITVTEELKQRYVERGARADKIAVVLNGVDPKVRLGDWSPPAESKADGTFTVISHGAIEDRYGQDTIIEAARLLRSELPDLQVVLAGRGKLVDAVIEQIEAADLSEIVHFVGWVSEHELNDLLHSADVGVVAQKASPYSHLVHTNKMVDYWIFGLPVIASRLRAVSNLYDDSVLEYYESGDAHDLARAIRRLHDSPERRAELSRNGRIAQETYGWAVQEREYLAVVERLR